MKRRQFLQTVASSAATLGLYSGTAVDALATSFGCRVLQNWTWINGRRQWTPDEWRSQFRRIKASGIGSVLVSGSNDGPARIAREVGIEFHRWMWILNRSGDGWVRENHPEWFTVSREGKSSLEHPPYVGYYRWLCPTRGPVREYLRGKVEEVARRPDIDGVHLDYIRHCDVILPVGLWSRYNLVQDQEYPEFDFCYCDVCRETFQAQTGRDPVELPDPPGDAEWREFRWNTLTELVRILADAVHDHGKRISAAVFPTPTIARRLVRQAWDQWPLDAVFPMIYQRFYNQEVPWIGKATEQGVSTLSGKMPLYSGLYLAQLSPEELGQAVRLATRAGASGVSLFEVGRLSDEHLVELRASL